MPRLLTANALAQIAIQKGNEPINVVVIAWNGTQEQYYADRDIVTPDGKTIKGGIISLGSLDEVFKLQGQTSSTAIDVTLDDTDGTIKALFDTVDIHKKPARILQYFAGMDFSDAFELLRGQINTPIIWSEGQRTIQFSILDKVESRQVGFAPEEGQFRGVSPQNVGKVWPLAFGNVVHVPATKATDKIVGTTASLIGIPDYTLPYKYWHLTERINVLKAGYFYYIDLINKLREIARDAVPIANDYIEIITTEDLQKQNAEDLDRWIVDNTKLLEKLYELVSIKFPTVTQNNVQSNLFVMISENYDRIFQQGAFANTAPSPEDLSERERILRMGTMNWLMEQLFEFTAADLPTDKLAANCGVTLNITEYSDGGNPRIHSRSEQTAKPSSDLEIHDFTYTTWQDAVHEITDVEVQMYFAKQMSTAVFNHLLVTQKTKELLEIEAHNAQYAYTTIREINKKIEKLLVQLVKAEQDLMKMLVVIKEQNQMPKSQVAVIGGEYFPQNTNIVVSISGLVYEGQMSGQIFTASNITTRYFNLEIGARESDELDAFWLKSSLVNIKGHYCMINVEIREGDPEWTLKEFGYDVDPIQVRIFKIRDQVGRKCYIELQPTEPVLRVRPQIKPNSLIGGVPQRKNDVMPVLEDLPDDVKVALRFAKEHTDKERERILENAIQKYTKDELDKLKETIKNLKDALLGARTDDDMDVANQMLLGDMGTFNRMVRNIKYTKDTIDKVNEVVSQKEYDLLLRLCNMKLAQAIQEYYDEKEIPTTRLYVITGPEITKILGTSAVILPSWLQYQTPLQTLIDGGTVITLPDKKTRIIAEFLPDTTLWISEPGSEVQLLSNENERYVANTLPSTVHAVYAKRAIGGYQRLVPVPSSYYIKNESDTVYTPLVCTTITLYKPLKDYAGEDWSDEIYVTMTSSVGPNTVDILEWILANYTTVTPDATSFGVVRAQIDPFPSSFALFDKRDAFQLIEDIAYQARCAVWVRGGVMFIRYLAAEPTPIATLSEDEIAYDSLTLECAPTENQATKIVAEWKPNYFVTKNNQIILRYNNNVYGEIEKKEDFYIYNIESIVYKAATFWLIRKSNSWKHLKCKTALTKLGVETFDAITVDLDYVANAAVTGIIEKATFDSASNRIEFDVWLPVRLGEMLPYAFAYPADLTVETMYPSITEINGGYAGSQHGAVPQASDYRFQDNYSLVEMLAIRPKDYGEAFPADAAFTAPINPVATFAEADYQIREKQKPKLGNQPKRAVGKFQWIGWEGQEAWWYDPGPGAFNHPVRNETIGGGGGGNGGDKRFLPAVDGMSRMQSGLGLMFRGEKDGEGGGGNGGTAATDEDMPLTFIGRVKEITNADMGRYVVENARGQTYDVEQYANQNIPLEVKDTVTCVYDYLTNRYYINTPGDGEWFYGEITGSVEGDPHKYYWRDLIRNKDGEWVHGTRFKNGRWGYNIEPTASSPYSQVVAGTPVMLRKSPTLEDIYEFYPVSSMTNYSRSTTLVQILGTITGGSLRITVTKPDTTTYTTAHIPYNENFKIVLVNMQGYINQLVGVDFCETGGTDWEHIYIRTHDPMFVISAVIITNLNGATSVTVAPTYGVFYNGAYNGGAIAANYWRVNPTPLAFDNTQGIKLLNNGRVTIDSASYRLPGVIDNDVQTMGRSFKSFPDGIKTGYIYATTFEPANYTYNAPIHIHHGNLDVWNAFAPVITPYHIVNFLDKWGASESFTHAIRRIPDTVEDIYSNPTLGYETIIAQYPIDSASSLYTPCVSFGTACHTGTPEETVQFCRVYDGTQPGVSITVTAASWSGGTARIYVPGYENLGQDVSITGIVPSGYNGTYTVTNSATYNDRPTWIEVAIASDPGAYVSGGLLTAPISSGSVISRFEVVRGLVLYPGLDLGGSRFNFVGGLVVDWYENGAIADLSDPGATLAQVITSHNLILQALRDHGIIAP